MTSRRRPDVYAVRHVPAPRFGDRRVPPEPAAKGRRNSWQPRSRSPSVASVTGLSLSAEMADVVDGLHPARRAASARLRWTATVDGSDRERAAVWILGQTRADRRSRAPPDLLDCGRSACRVRMLRPCRARRAVRYPTRLLRVPEAGDHLAMGRRPTCQWQDLGGVYQPVDDATLRQNGG
jgi:hypothetical protein